MDVQNRLRRVEARLPEEVRRQGVQVVKANAGFLMIVALTSKSTPCRRSSWATSRCRAWWTSCDACRAWATCARSPPSTPCGSGSIRRSSRRSILRRPTRSPRCRSRTVQSSGGSLGDRPLAEGSELNAAILTQSRFSTPEQFANVILRANPDGSVIRLGDVARVELGAQTYGFDIEMNGEPAAGMAIQLTPGANALAVASAVKARMAQLETGFPKDIAVDRAVRLDAIRQRVDRRRCGRSSRR